MPEQPDTSPVSDSVPKVGGEVAVGENLRFQRRWWAFERVVWCVFALLILFDLLGAFGEGWLAKAHASAPGGGLTLDFDRIERASTPSTMNLRLGPGAVRNGRVQVYVSDSVVKGLGAQRISPEPAVSAIGGGGVTYSFPVTGGPAEVQIQLQPTAPGPHAFRVQAAGGPPIDARVFVMP